MTRLDHINAYLMGFLIQQFLARLQSWHSGGVPLQLPPKDWGKQEPEAWPGLLGPTYLTSHPPPLVQL